MSAQSRRSTESENISYLLEHLDKDLIEKMWEPVYISRNRESILPPGGLTDVELICLNPDKELPPIKKTQLNFRVPPALRNSNESIIIEIKKTIAAYITTYEKQARDINAILDFTRKRIINMYNPLKSIKEELQNYAIEFESSMNNLAIPIKNKNDLLNSIIPKREKIKQFEKDKALIIKEINNYGQESKLFHQKYSQLNKQNLNMVQTFVDSFQKLFIPAKECSNIIKKGMQEFEQSAPKFMDIKKTSLMIDTLDELKKKTKDMQNKFEDIKKIYDNIEEIKPEKQEELRNTLNEMKDINKKLKEKSDTITKKIEEVRKNYHCPPAVAKSMQLVDYKSNINGVAVNGSNSLRKNIDECVQKIVDERVFNTLPDLFNYMRLDILFIMDITTSMDEYLNQAKKEMEDMIKIIQKACPTADVFIGFIGYRDYNDLDLGKEYVDIDFTQNYKSVIESIKDVEADGGGDVPEDLAGAFYLALNKDWKGRSKFAILVTDAPCHGEKYHHLGGELKDNYPEGDREQRNIEEQIALFALKEINLFCMKITDLTDLMYDMFKKIYEEKKPINSNCNFVIQQKGKLKDIVTSRAIEVYGKKEDFVLEEA